MIWSTSCLIKIYRKKVSWPELSKPLRLIQMTLTVFMLWQRDNPWAYQTSIWTRSKKIVLERMVRLMIGNDSSITRPRIM